VVISVVLRILFDVCFVFGLNQLESDVSDIIGTIEVDGETAFLFHEDFTWSGLGDRPIDDVYLHSIREFVEHNSESGPDLGSPYNAVFFSIARYVKTLLPGRTITTTFEAPAPTDLSGEDDIVF
jgi:hypothetical protein